MSSICVLVDRDHPAPCDMRVHERRGSASRAHQAAQDAGLFGWVVERA